MPFFPLLFFFGILYAPILLVLGLAWLLYMGITRGIPWLFWRYDVRKAKKAQEKKQTTDEKEQD
jgi:hypothetical protein